MSDQPPSHLTPASVVARNYPEDMRELLTCYSNHAAVIVTSNEVYIDFFQLQPHSITDNKAQAIPLVRVIMTHPQARNIFQAGNQATEQIEHVKKTSDGN